MIDLNLPKKSGKKVIYLIELCPLGQSWLHTNLAQVHKWERETEINRQIEKERLEERDRHRNTAYMENEFMLTVLSTHEPWLC